MRTSLIITATAFFLTACSSQPIEQQPQASSSMPSSERQDDRELYVPTYDGAGLLVYGDAQNPQALGNIASTDSPSTVVRYSNADWGLSVDIPFHPMWGTEKYSIAPYHEWQSGLVFGPLAGCEGGGYCRETFLTAVEARSAQEAAAFYQAEADTDSCRSMNCIHDIQTSSIGDMTVVSFQEEGLSSTTTWEVIGKKYNYVLKNLSLHLSNEDMQRVLESMTFVE